MKKRILVVNEFSQLSTGFSTYMNEVLQRLHSLDKYEIAELATYVNPLDPRIKKIPWKVFANEPHPENKEMLDRYKSTRENQFGKFAFDQTCLEFKPDIVITIRDYWMDAWIEESPYRPFFKWINMPTVDGEPQKVEWLELYKKCDAILTYSLWGANLLERQTNGQIQPVAVASPAADHEVFVPPEDKDLVKDSFGLQKEVFIVQTVMRNQPRKLFPELLKGFNLFLDKCKKNKREDIANKTFLYFHTSFPDMGWNMPEELRKYKLSHKVLFTYHCESCKTVYPSFYAGERSACRACRKALSSPPNTSKGIDRSELAKVQQIADVYVQYATNGGWEMGINDAKSCGVPCLVVDYSAMSEQTTNGGALPVRVQNFYQEPVYQTNQLRASPDNEDFANKLYVLLTDDEFRVNLGKEARECIEKYYTWDKVAKIWDSVIEKVDVLEHEESWLSPPRYIKPNTNVPNNLSNEDFLKFLYTEVERKPSKINSFEYHRVLQMLNNGYDVGQTPDGKPTKIPIDRQKIADVSLNRVKVHNIMERTRHYFNCPPKENQQEVRFVEV